MLQAFRQRSPRTGSSAGLRRLRPVADREAARRWHTMLADALADQDVVNVGDTITRFLGRTPTRAEMNAARRAAPRLAASGYAVAHRIDSPELDRRGSARLVLARPGATMDEGRLPRDPAIDRHFEPAVMAHELAKSVEVLAAAIDTIPSAQLDQAAVDRLVASVNVSLAELRRIRRHLRAQL